MMRSVLASDRSASVQPLPQRLKPPANAGGFVFSGTHASCHGRTAEQVLVAHVFLPSHDEGSRRPAVLPSASRRAQQRRIGLPTSMHSMMTKGSPPLFFRLVTMHEARNRCGRERPRHARVDARPCPPPRFHAKWARNA